MSEKSKELKQLFSSLFEVNEREVEACTFGQTEKWDSLSHMTLMVGLEEINDGASIPLEVMAQLTSFEKCREFVNRTP